MNNLEDKVKKALNLFNKKNYLEAKLILLELIEDPNVDKKVYFLLYEVFIRINDEKNAKKYLIKFIEFNTNNHVALNKLANLYLKERETKKAEKFYLKAINSKNDYLTAITNLAVYYQGIGDKENALKFYQIALNVSPKNLAVYYNINKIDKDFIEKEKIDFIDKTLKNEKLDSFNMASGYFLIAEDKKKKKLFSSEIENLKIAHKYAFDANLNSNKQSFHYWMNIMPKKYDKIKFSIEKEIPEELKNLKPIFIIGLPRSGSTIIESILSSGKKKILNLGETSLINWSIINTYTEIFTEGSIGEERLLKLDANLICGKLLKSLDNLGASNLKNKIFIEKSLENFFYIDLILKIFPKAKFINTIRNTHDNIFAIFQQFLSKVSWTHSLENIIDYMDNYLKIIGFFKQKYPDKILSVKLEELTDNKELISKKLYNFCELEWNDTALEFYKRKDLFSSTASNVQIRSNLYKYDREKYRPYKEFLKKFSHKYNWIDED